MTLLEIIKSAAIEMRIAVPLSADVSTDQTAVDLVYFANKSLKEAILYHDWTVLSAEGELVGDGVTTAFVTPQGFDRLAHRQKLQRKGETAYRLFGPLNADQRVNWRARNVVTVNNVFWFRGGKIVVTPAMQTGQIAVFEYQSKLAVKQQSGDLKQSFEAGSDEPLLDSDLVLKGLIWLWKQAKGFEYGQDFETWKSHINILASRDQSMESVPIGAPSMDLPDPVIPETIRVA